MAGRSSGQTSATLYGMFDDFVPHERLKNGHAMTLWAWARPRTFPALPPSESRVFEVASDSRVLARCNWQRNRTAAATILILHGLEGSSDAHYMRGLADKAWAHGFNVVRLNQRNCGGTEHLSVTLYHSGLSEDVDVVMRALVHEGLSSFVVAGYSLGGNLALKLAGDYGNAAPSWLGAVAAVSPVMDLPRCVAALERGSNAIYQWNFVRNLKARMRRKAAAFPDRFSTEPLARIRTVRDFDEAYTAPFFGFRDATDYYYRAASLRVVDRIAVPALIVSSADDPFVPAASFADPALERNPSITVRVTAHGGHCAFVGARSGVHDGYWAEWAVMQFLSQYARRP
jgi:predicted alpha/beta-fold hydrolase